MTSEDIFPNKKPASDTWAKPLTLEEFNEVNSQSLSEIFAETGRDREGCFDLEADIEFVYDHPETYKRDYPQLQYTKGLY